MDLRKSASTVLDGCEIGGEGKNGTGADICSYFGNYFTVSLCSCGLC